MASFSNDKLVKYASRAALNTKLKISVNETMLKHGIVHFELERTDGMDFFTFHDAVALFQDEVVKIIMSNKEFGFNYKAISPVRINDVPVLGTTEISSSLLKMKIKVVMSNFHKHTISVESL